MKKTTTRKSVRSVAKGEKTASKGAAKEPAEAATFFGLPLRAWVSGVKSARGAGAAGKSGNVFYFARRNDKELRSTLRGALLPWQLDHLAQSDAESVSFAGRAGPVFILRPPSSVDTKISESHGGALEKAPFARARDLVGALVSQLGSWKLESLHLHFLGTTVEEERGALLGLEIGAYSFMENRSNPRRPRKRLPKLLLKESQLAAGDIRWAAELGLSLNFARHLTNMPPGELNPATYGAALEDALGGLPGIEIDVWSGDKLVEERLNLLRAVGQGAKEGPRLVHIRYRPATGGTRRPVALVGKGITFDTGGLDMKPSSSMRWMKKDMGGSAAVAAIAFWAARTGLEQPLDVYLALAENAVSAESFHPSDVITSRNGLMVEIHNTDAEGRLVLADALDVAVTAEGEDAPLAVINVATLTGAIKVALGPEIAGLFSNNDGLADMIEISGAETGEFCWRMPLFQPYKSYLKSTFGDFANATEGFAGAVTAALFLQQFVGSVPWAHLDIYAWRDGSSGAWTESGGSGQMVQLLANLLQQWSEQEVGA